MPNTFTLSLLGGISITGAALGVHLGRSAIDEINPAYFRDPEIPFYSDLVPNRGIDWAQVQAKEYAETAVPITQCIGCIDAPPPDYPVEYVPAHDPYVDLVLNDPPVSRRAPETEAAPVIVLAETPDPGRERIVRYARYPVTQEEAQAMEEEDDEGEAAEPAGAYAATQ